MDTLKERLDMSRSSLEAGRIKSSIRPLGDQGVLEGDVGDRWLEGETASRSKVRPWSMLSEIGEEGLRIFSSLEGLTYWILESRVEEKEGSDRCYTCYIPFSF